MTFLLSGDLGIGVTEPNSKLHVGGGATVTGDLNVGSNLGVDGSIWGNSVVTQSLTTPSLSVSVLTGNVNATKWNFNF